MWAPELYVVCYHGKKENREVIKAHEFWPTAKKVGSDPMLKFHVLLTSYEYISKDVETIAPIEWAALIVDEAQRLKSAKSQFFNVTFYVNYGRKFSFLVLF